MSSIAEVADDDDGDIEALLSDVIASAMKHLKSGFSKKACQLLKGAFELIDGSPGLEKHASGIMDSNSV